MQYNILVPIVLVLSRFWDFGWAGMASFVRQWKMHRLSWTTALFFLHNKNIHFTQVYSFKCASVVNLFRLNISYSWGYCNLQMCAMRTLPCASKFNGNFCNVRTVDKCKLRDCYQVCIWRCVFSWHLYCHDYLSSVAMKYTHTTLCRLYSILIIE